MLVKMVPCLGKLGRKSVNMQKGLGMALWIVLLDMVLGPYFILSHSYFIIVMTSLVAWLRGKHLQLNQFLLWEAQSV
nr:uncharacterized protein LOC107847847 isoform X1 [Ipomoea batatas]